MSLLKRIVDIWVSDADEEIYRVLDEWRIEGSTDEVFMPVVDLIESHVVDGEYERAAELFDEYFPYWMTDEEGYHFLYLLDEAEYYG